MNASQPPLPLLAALVFLIVLLTLDLSLGVGFFLMAAFLPSLLWAVALVAKGRG